MTSHITINQVEKNRRKMVELNFQKHARKKNKYMHDTMMHRIHFKITANLLTYLAIPLKIRNFPQFPRFFDK